MDENVNLTLPSVHMTRSAVLIIILGVYEAFRKEGFGMVFGSCPTRNRDYYSITHAIAPQLLSKRSYTSLELHERGRKKIKEFVEKTRGLFPSCLGYYHSHTEYMGVKPTSEMSDIDVQSVKSEKLPLEVLIAVSSRNKKKAYLPWEVLEDGSLRGSLLGLNFHFNVFTLVDEENSLLGKRPEGLRIVAPKAIKTLNRVHKNK